MITASGGFCCTACWDFVSYTSLCQSVADDRLSLVARVVFVFSFEGSVMLQKTPKAVRTSKRHS